VVTECSWNVQDASSVGQKLVVRRGNCDPVTVLEFPMRPLGPDPYSRCQGYGSFRVGEQTVDFGDFQRSAVLPDGSGVVFEVTNDFSLFPALTPEPPEKGMFFVHADGAGLRRLGPASRIPTFYAIGRVVYNIPELFFAVSPDGRTIAFSDLGTGSDRQETAQIFTLDIATGRRRKQVTHLPLPAKPTRLSCIAFLDNRTLTFCKRVDSGDGNGVIISGVFTVRTDGSRFEEVPVVALPGGGIVPVFTVEGSGSRAAVTVVFHEPARNHFFMLFIDPFIEELFLLQGKTVLDLGCCQGFWSFEASRAGAVRCEGIDSSEVFVNEARAVGTVLGIENCNFRCCQLENDPWWNELVPADITLMLGLFYHLSDPIFVLRKLARLTLETLVVDSQTLPGRGVLLGILPRDPAEPTTRGSKVVSSLRLVPTKRALLSLISDAGFDKIECLKPDWRMPLEYHMGRRVTIIAAKRI